MTGRGASARVGSSDPMIGPGIPTAALHLAFLAVGVALCLLLLESFWLLLGLMLAIAGSFMPHRLSPWWLLLLLGLSQLGRAPSVTDARFYILLAGIHLLHILASVATLAPWHGRMQVIALAALLRRYVLVQVVAQSVAVGTLLMVRGGRGTVPGLSVIAAAMLAAVAVLLAQRVGSSE